MAAFWRSRAVTFCTSLDVGRERLVRQLVDDELLELACQIAGRLELAGKAQRDVVLRLLELLGRHRLQDAVQLVEELLQRLGGLVGLHAGRGEERPGARRACRTRSSRRRCSRAPRAGSVQPRGERAAENRVQHLERRVVRRRARHADPADANLRLRRARLVDEVDLARLSAAARCRHRRRRAPRALGLPRSERLLEQRHHRCRGVTSPTTSSVALSGR